MVVLAIVFVPLLVSARQTGVPDVTGRSVKEAAQDPPAGTVVPKKGQISVQVAGPVRPC